MKQFELVDMKKPNTNVFDLSHDRKLTTGWANLVPILTEEVLPGDSFKVRQEIFLRLAPMISPIMHRVNVYVYSFFVPYRIVWDNWTNFITGGERGTDTSVMPRIAITNQLYNNLFVSGGLPDYFGVPTTTRDATLVNGLTINALPFRMYQLIYNEYFRDQNLHDPVPISRGDEVTEAEMLELVTMRQKCWEKDYFTSALPWAQAGGQQVMLPTDIQYKLPAKAYVAGGTPAQGAMAAAAGDVQSNSISVEIDNIESIGTTINDLRASARLQEWLEKALRGGGRYIEQILSHFGVRVPDYKLIRPEFLSGSMQPIVISEVLSSTETTDSEGTTIKMPLGQMAGHGISIGSNNGFVKHFNEHGMVITLMSVLPKTSYQQGIDRHFTKGDKFDYYWPEFANLGEQEIYQKEIYHDYHTAPTNDPNKTFGYASRYSEYKFRASSVHGDFRTNLTHMHLGRIFTQEPVLNGAFVTADPSNRIFADVDPDVHKIWVQVFNHVRAKRPIPYFSVPTL